MPADLTLSQQVQSFIDTLESEGHREIPHTEREEAEKAEDTARLIVDFVVASRESAVGTKLEAIETLVQEIPEVIEALLDKKFTRELVESVPGYVSRTLKLSRLQSARTPSKTTNAYVREAVRTYIFGFAQASIALSRAALEQALKEELGNQGKKLFLTMNDLLDEAEGAKVIDSVIRTAAREIATEGDRVLHERPADIDAAYEVLVKLKGVLQHVYGE